MFVGNLTRFRVVTVNNPAHRWNAWTNNLMLYSINFSVDLSSSCYFVSTAVVRVFIKASGINKLPKLEKQWVRNKKWLESYHSLDMMNADSLVEATPRSYYLPIRLLSSLLLLLVVVVVVVVVVLLSSLLLVVSFLLFTIVTHFGCHNNSWFIFLV